MSQSLVRILYLLFVELLSAKFWLAFRPGVDEEDLIDDDLNKNNGGGAENLRVYASRRKPNNLERGKEGQMFDRLVKTGFSKHKESMGFPNYFIAQKVRAKISTE